MSRTGSKKDTVIGAARLKNAVILFEADWRRLLSSYTRDIYRVFLPPATSSQQFQFTLSKARAENGKPISVIQSPIFELSQKAKADKLTLGLDPR